MKATNVLHRAMHVVWYQRTATAIKMVSEVDSFCIFFLFAVALAASGGDTEQVVAQWWHLVSFMKALDLLHWVMNVVLHRRTAIAIEMVCGRGAFVCCCRLFCLS
jgi:hypothetical protein